jgi:hypothetical protein
VQWFSYCMPRPTRYIGSILKNKTVPSETNLCAAAHSLRTTALIIVDLRSKHARRLARKEIMRQGGHSMDIQIKNQLQEPKTIPWKN